jgi:hypothetical protein
LLFEATLGTDFTGKGGSLLVSPKRWDRYGVASRILGRLLINKLSLPASVANQIF